MLHIIKPESWEDGPSNSERIEARLTPKVARDRQRETAKSALVRYLQLALYSLAWMAMVLAWVLLVGCCCVLERLLGS